MTRVAVLGAQGFVGSAFADYLGGLPELELLPVTRASYASARGASVDVVIDCSCNSRKFLAEETPLADLELSVAHRVRTLLDFPAPLHVHVSSVDVYSRLDSPLTTAEDAAVDLSRLSHYGFHKLLAEEAVRHYAPRWLIVRLAGMVGPRLRKNPVFDILNRAPLRIQPDSRYQFMSTLDVARCTWRLVTLGRTDEVFNLCGAGTISPAEIGRLAGLELNLELLNPADPPRIVDVDTSKVGRLLDLPATAGAISAFLEFWRHSTSAAEP